jgi:CDP-diacylglycerol---glycerol-3-phosphate 3-phosphatidyltransferase
MTFKDRLDRFLVPATRLFAGCGVTPDMLTLMGTALTVVTPWALLKGYWFLAGFWLLLAGAFDTLDGALARNEGLRRPFGAFLDSSMDRVSEAIVFAGFILFYYRLQQPDYVLLAFAACLLAQLVSYTRARAEGLGLECRVGVLTRAGRVSLLALGIWTGLLHWALGLVAVGSAVTVVQRVLLVRSLLGAKAPRTGPNKRHPKRR